MKMKEIVIHFSLEITTMQEEQLITSEQRGGEHSLCACVCVCVFQLLSILAQSGSIAICR